MLLAMLLVFNMALLGLGDISATIATGNITDSNSTPEIAENTTNDINNTNTTDLNATENSTNTTNSGTNSTNNTVTIYNDTEAAGSSTNTNYTNISGIWLWSSDVSSLDVDALLNANITDIFVKINSTNYQSVLNAILTKVKGTEIRINAWITCFKDGNNWIDPQGKYNYTVSVPYTATVKTSYKVWYKGYTTTAYKVKVKTWYKSWYKSRGKWKYKWKYKYTYKTKYKKVYGWKYYWAYKTSYVTKYRTETRTGYSTAYKDKLISFISNVTTNYNIDGIHLDYVRYSGVGDNAAYKNTGGTEAITSFVKQVYDKVQTIETSKNSTIAVSAALMPEGSANAYYYGQNYTQLSNYLDFLVPMIYKGNYGKDTSWIGSTVKYIVSQANGKPVVAGLQTYESDTNTTRLSASELNEDINTAIGNGSAGYALFRYGLISSDFMPVKSTSSESSSPTINNTTNSATFTLTAIENAAASVKSYVETNNRLPNYVTIGTSQITMPQFLQMLVNALLQLNSGINTPISAGNVSAPTNSSGNYMYGNINSTEYLKLASTISSYIELNEKAPNYATSSLGNIQYESLVYMYSKILNFYGTNSRLPSYVTVDSSVTNTTIPSELQQYLAATANCQVNDATIKALAASITKGMSSNYDKAVAIFNWVRDNIGYSFYYNTKYGAVGTLNADTGNCVDTTHLLIALERAAGIPAKYVHGTCTFTSGSVYGHVWAQVWVDGKWYSADATSSRNTFGVINNWNTATYTLKGIYASLPF